MMAMMMVVMMIEMKVMMIKPTCEETPKNLLLKYCSQCILRVSSSDLGP